MRGVHFFGTLKLKYGQTESRLMSARFINQSVNYSVNANNTCNPS